MNGHQVNHQTDFDAESASSCQYSSSVPSICPTSSMASMHHNLFYRHPLNGISCDTNVHQTPSFSQIPENNNNRQMHTIPRNPHPVSKKPATKQGNTNRSSKSNRKVISLHSSLSKGEPGLASQLEEPEAQPQEEKIDYKTNGSVKPPFSYATLICMAMKDNKSKMTLNSIYKWIRDNFLYYQNADPSWQVRNAFSSQLLSFVSPLASFLH
jgi:hypothetical protein